MARYCPTCNRIVEDAGEHCTQCGSGMPESSSSGYFVSGPPLQRVCGIDLTPNTRLDRFTVVRRLRGGQSAAVYLARDGVRSQDVVLKVAAAGPSASSSEVEQLQAEMELHARINDHRNVVRAYDVHFVPTGGSGLLVLSMEYADGGTLRDWLTANRENLERRQLEGLRYFKEICYGISAIHDAGILHLDLKPENLVFVGKTLKVADLGGGLAKHPVEVSSTNTWDRFPACPGTPPYMSPEQFEAPSPEDLDKRADIYALGVIFFEMLHPTGRTPFQGSFERLRGLHAGGRPPALPNADLDCARVINRCLEKDPGRRYGDVAALLDDLERKVEPGATPAEPAETATVTQLWEQANWHAAAGECEAAKRYCHKLLRVNPGHEQAQEMLEDLSTPFEQAEQIYGTIATQMETRSLSELVSLLNDAVSLYPNHPSGLMTQVSLAAKARTFRSSMEEGWRAAQDGLWDAAVAHFERAQHLDPTESGVVQAIGFVDGVRAHIQELRDEIQRALDLRDLRRALSLARAVDEYVEGVRDAIKRASTSE